MYLCIYLFIYLFTFLHVYIFLYFCVSMYLLIHLSIYIFTCLYIFIHLCIYLFSYILYVYIYFMSNFYWLSHSTHGVAVICKLRGHGSAVADITSLQLTARSVYHEIVSQYPIHLLTIQTCLTVYAYSQGPGALPSWFPIHMANLALKKMLAPTQQLD